MVVRSVTRKRDEAHQTLEKMRQCNLEDERKKSMKTGSKRKKPMKTQIYHPAVGDGASHQYKRM
jgi:hypothetical protein